MGSSSKADATDQTDTATSQTYRAADAPETEKGGEARQSDSAKRRAGDSPPRPGAQATGLATDSAAERGGELSDLLRGCERSALYHKAREGALESFHRFGMFLVLVSGSGAVLAIARDNEFAPYVALIPAVFGALDLVFAFGRQARDHAVLARQFMDLAADASRGALDVGAVRARFYQLAAEEPPVYEAVESLCFNQVASAMSDPRRRQVSWLHNRLRHIIRFSGKKFETKRTGAI